SRSTRPLSRSTPHRSRRRRPSPRSRSPGTSRPNPAPSADRPRAGGPPPAPAGAPGGEPTEPGLIGGPAPGGRTAVLVGYGPRTTAAKRRPRVTDAEPATPPPAAMTPAG